MPSAEADAGAASMAATICCSSSSEPQNSEVTRKVLGWEPAPPETACAEGEGRRSYVGECCFDAGNAVMPAMSLLAGLYPDDDLKAYFIRQRCGPQPGMRR
jgi:hypothetical protein